MEKKPEDLSTVLVQVDNGELRKKMENCSSLPGELDGTEDKVGLTTYSELTESKLLNSSSSPSLFSNLLFPLANMGPHKPHSLQTLLETLGWPKGFTFLRTPPRQILSWLFPKTPIPGNGTGGSDQSVH